MILKVLKYKIFPILNKWLRNISDNKKVSYSQCGEDLIIQHICTNLGIQKISYLDIGAHHPTYISNTYLLYKNGGYGVCVEADPSLYVEFNRKRPHDINLNCGVGVSPGEAEFYIMSTSTLNTFLKAEAERYQSFGKQRIVKKINIQMRTINEILATNFERCPNLVSLDVEGMDFQILQSFDFEKFRPEVFCLETLSYTEDKSERKLTEIIDLMHANGYLTYADTYINTIFVDNKAWKNRP